MSSFKIATWNVNSIRVRLPHVLTWLHTAKPDVLALQELKVPTPDFPASAFEEAGYAAVVSGQKTYNGVAFLIKKHFHDAGAIPLVDLPDYADPQRRILGLTIQGMRLFNLYVPNGESPTSEKYQYKMLWLENIRRYLQHEIKMHPQLVVLGDFNIAPAPLDVYDAAAWEGRVLFTDKEREAFQALLKLGLHDSLRTLAPNEKVFSWWDYRVNAFKRKMGLRIDHILLSSPLMSACEKSFVDPTPRAWERPSDHAPAIVVLNTSS